MRFNYRTLTLEDIEMYTFFDFICDGDSKNIIVEKRDT